MIPSTYISPSIKMRKVRDRQLSDLPNITILISGRARNWTQVSLAPKSMFITSVSISYCCITNNPPTQWLTTSTTYYYSWVIWSAEQFCWSGPGSANLRWAHLSVCCQLRAGWSRTSLSTWLSSPPCGLSSSVAIAGVWEREETFANGFSIHCLYLVCYSLILPKQITCSGPESVLENTSKSSGHRKA